MANATIRVTFGNPELASEVNAYLAAEIDNRPDGLNQGKTSFAPGDPVYILVYKTSNVTITQVQASAGSIAQSGSDTVDVEEDIMFEDSDTATLQRPAISSPSSTWLGRNLGSLALQSDKVTVKAGQKGVAVARVKYTTNAVIYRLASPPSLNGLTDFTILAVIQGDVKA